jgi:hypothetical protein
LFDINILNLTNQFGVTPLHYACYFGSRRVIDLLLDYKAEVNIKDNDGNTPLHYAINSGCHRTIKKLLIRGARKDIKNLEDKTAYNLAIDTNQPELAKLVETKGFIKKYICMETEITEFKPARNDILLFVILLFTVTFKLIYIIRLYTIRNGTGMPLSMIMTCLGKYTYLIFR